jgi:hypothetical protein
MIYDEGNRTFVSSRPKFHRPVSNPLIRPNDPRFTRPPLRDAEGNNVFADPDAPVAAEPADGGSLPAKVVEPAESNFFAAPAAQPTDEPAYQPQYETTHPHRGILLLVLSIVGLAGSGSLLLIVAGSIFGLMGLAAIIPAAAAWLLGRQDLKAMRQGAIDASGLVQTSLAMWLGLAGTLIYAVSLGGLLLAAGYFGVMFLRDV